jgi:hypothetical protein
MNLESGVDVSDVVDRNKFNLLRRTDLIEDFIKFSTLVTSSDKGAGRIKETPMPFEGNDITSRLVLFFEEKGL